MNQAKLFSLRTFFVMMMLGLFSLTASAQENNEGSGGGGTGETTTTTTTTKTTDIKITAEGNDTWYTQPWVWIVGAAVFILLLVALLSGGRGRDSVTTSERVTIKKE